MTRNFISNSLVQVCYNYIPKVTQSDGRAAMLAALNCNKGLELTFSYYCPKRGSVLHVQLSCRHCSRAYSRLQVLPGILTLKMEQVKINLGILILFQHVEQNPRSQQTLLLIVPAFLGKNAGTILWYLHTQTLLFSPHL